MVCDTNDNGVANTGEPFVFTQTDGKFSFPQGCTHGVIVSGGKIKDEKDAAGNVVSGGLFAGVLRAPAGATVASPLTTLMASAGLTQTELKKALGLDDKIDLLTTDPGLATANPDLAKKTATVQLLMQTVAALSSGSVGGDLANHAVYNEVAASFASSLKAAAQANTPLISTDGTLAVSLVSKLSSEALTKVAASKDVPVEVTAVLNANLTKAGVANVAAVAATAMKQEADIVLKAAATEIASTMLVKQNNLADPSKVTVASSIKTAIDAGTLTTLTSATDIAALKAKVAESTGTAAVVTPPPPPTSGVLASFDETTPPATAGFGGAEGSSVKTGPTGGTGKALNVLRSGGFNYAGASVTTGVIPFAASRKTITARVYSPKAGIPIKIKAEYASQQGTVEASATTAVVVGWQTLTWVLSDVDLTKSYTSLVLLPDMGTVAPTTGDSYYFDDITLVADSTVVTPPAPASGVLATFDETSPPATSGFGGAEGSSVKTGPTGGAGKALNVFRSGGFDYAGASVTTGVIPFAASRKTITARVYSPKAGIPIKIKAEYASQQGTVEASATTAVVVGWQTLTWVLSDVDLTKSYTSLVLLPDMGTVAPTTGDSYYFDDITLVADSTTVAADTTPPTLTITDNVSATDATGPVLFTFTFSEDVGTSFAASAITVSNGAKGALTKMSATSYTMTVTPTANSTGTIAVSVAVGAFKDIADNTNTAAASASQAFNTIIAVSTPYLYLANNALTLTDGVATSSYTMTDFQSTSGINVKWPMASNTALKLNLAESGSFTMAQGQTLQAAVSITQETPSGSGEVQAYIDNVTVTKTGSDITLTVPSVAKALVYGVSGDGTKRAVIDFAGAVAGITNTLSSALNAVSTVVLGDVVNYAVNGVSNDFTGMYSLTGKYKVSIVVTQLPLRKADGSAFPAVTVQVPTLLDSSGKVVPTSVVPITGYGLVGYINLTQ